MQILLSCAKDMKAERDVESPLTPTLPAFQAQANLLAQELIACSAEELQTMLHCNPQLAALNKLRYEHFFDETPPKPAALSYTGHAFKHLRASDFSKEDFLYANEHLFICSFLYGLLRPLDGIRNYRLEGTARRPGTKERYFEYWRDFLTEALIQTTKADDGILVNLASEEMKGLFHWKEVEKSLEIIQPEFFVEKEGKLKTIVIYAKMCRGAMARQIILQRWKSVEDLRFFECEGFSHREDWKFVL